VSDFERFNIDTMSGVFPGTRTMVFQRVRLRASNAPDARPHWVRVLWYEEPAACVVELNVPTAPAADPSLAGSAEGTRLVIGEPATGDLRLRLEAGLAAHGWQLRSCGTCAFWQPKAAATADGLAAGACTWSTADGGVAVPEQLAAQSLLAPECAHWQPAVPAAADTTVQTPDAAVAPPIRRRAEQETDERWSLWGQVRRLFSRKADTAASGGVAQPGWEAGVVERSGVGAGTESCFACQGRIANLGALAVATPEGDRQTFSIWRCRNCYTYYLNDWIDRWERTDSLETEETYYRLAPAEAFEALAVIDGVVHAEHPARRHERDAQRRWMLAYLDRRTPLSHQIKQGR
jgi:hypothetical protein